MMYPKNTFCRKKNHNFKSERTHRESNGRQTWKPLNQLQINRESSGKGFRHLLLKKDIVSFTEILPHWSALSWGLGEILLARGEDGCDGWYKGSVIAISAWERDLWRSVPPDYYQNHSSLLARLGVECLKQGNDYLCKFTFPAARAFQLLHVFLHELGHHYDRITTRKMREVSRGDPFAERYAFCFGELIWKRYLERFGL